MRSPGTGLLMCGVVALSSCATPESRFASQEERYREDMIARYPLATDWREPQDKLGSFTRWQLTAPAPDGFAEFALARARTLKPRVRSCWWGFVARPALGPVFGAMDAAATGSFVDYVFLDSDDRVVVAYRRFCD